MVVIDTSVATFPRKRSEDTQDLPRVASDPVDSSNVRPRDGVEVAAKHTLGIGSATVHEPRPAAFGNDLDKLRDADLWGRDARLLAVEEFPERDIAS